MKENKIEKFILDLSNRWECTPQEAVDRLNSMNESEINKLIKSMVKKFQGGGRTWPYKYYDRELPNGEYYSYNEKTTEGPHSEVIEKVSAPGKVLYRRIYPKFPVLPGFGVDTTLTRVTTDPQGAIKSSLEIPSPHNPRRVFRDGDARPYPVITPEQWKELNQLMDERRREAISFKNGGVIDCLRAGGNLTECKKCGGKAAIKAVGGSIPPKRYVNIFENLKKNQNSSVPDTTKKKEIVRIPGLHKQFGPTIPPLSKPTKKK